MAKRVVEIEQTRNLKWKMCEKWNAVRNWNNFSTCNSIAFDSFATFAGSQYNKRIYQSKNWISEKQNSHVYSQQLSQHDIHRMKLQELSICLLQIDAVSFRSFFYIFFPPTLLLSQHICRRNFLISKPSTVDRHDTKFLLLMTFSFHSIFFHFCTYFRTICNWFCFVCVCWWWIA